MSANRAHRQRRRTSAPVTTNQRTITATQRREIGNQAIREKAAKQAGVAPHTLSMDQARKILGLVKGTQMPKKPKKKPKKPRPTTVPKAQMHPAAVVVTHRSAGATRPDERSWRRRYEAYLQSPEWAKVRRQALLREPRCRACGGGRNLHVHHITYVRLTCEIPEDLMVLCKADHQRVHELARTAGMSVAAATKNFLANHPDLGPIVREQRCAPEFQRKLVRVKADRT